MHTGFQEGESQWAGSPAEDPAGSDSSLRSSAVRRGEGVFWRKQHREGHRRARESALSSKGRCGHQWRGQRGVIKAGIMAEVLLHRNWEGLSKVGPKAWA